ncbi:transposase [Mycobacterium avium]|uniref:transposase n=1 Tax=Mycobacterium avium TaxID=1764 RepID=UPI001EEE2E42|nr:transposase [Mycobacterium avium]
MKVREGGRVVNGVVLLATGVNGDGHREVLGMRVVTSETGGHMLLGQMLIRLAA